MVDTDNNRGRPTGYRLSEESKDKIRNSRLGKPHSKETKNKISQSLIKHFKEKDPLSECLEKEYSEFSDEVCEWICEKEFEINELDDVITNKRLLYLNQVEISYGNDIERFCHNTTPEFLMMLKESLISLGLFEEMEELGTLI